MPPLIREALLVLLALRQCCMPCCDPCRCHLRSPFSSPRPPCLLPPSPSLLSRRFLVPRPDGRHCLVVASHGTTLTRLRNGRPLMPSFPSMLPNGARGRGRGRGGEGGTSSADGFCILDCVFHEVRGRGWGGFELTLTRAGGQQLECFIFALRGVKS